MSLNNPESNTDKESKPEDLENQKVENVKESDAGDGTTSTEHHLEGSKLVLCLTSLLLIMFLVSLDQTITSAILLVVGNKFHGLDKIGWITSGFMLSMAIFVSFWGKVSIILGRKITILIAIFLFEAGTLMCALAGDMNVLIGGRVLAGIGGGGIHSLVIIIMTEVSSLEKRPVVMSMFGVVMSVSSVVGPLIGGGLTTNVSWRWCFYIVWCSGVVV